MYSSKHATHRLSELVFLTYHCHHRSQQMQQNTPRSVDVNIGKNKQ